jgi:adenylate kinase
LEVPDDVIIQRVAGRKVCRSCGASFHIVFNPPQKKDVCDLCGGELYTRKDDNVETVTKRLVEYHSQTKPVFEYYIKKGIFTELDGTKEMAEVTKDILNILEK